jgi:phage baseplate assembly protein W
MSNSNYATTSKFTFKSVGNIVTDEKFNNKTTAESLVRNIGIMTPVRQSGTSEIFDMHKDPREQLKDNLKNLIMTNQGERLCRHDFGANLKSILYDYTKEQEYVNLVSKLIRKTVETYMPVIDISEVNVLVLNNLEKNNANLAGLAKLKLRVIFSVPKLRAENLAVEVEMFIGG